VAEAAKLHIGARIVAGISVAAPARMAPPHNPAQDRRRSVRVSILGAVYGQSAGIEHSLIVRNLSAGGFAVESPVPFFVGAKHQFEIALDGSPALPVEATVKHCMRFHTVDGERYLTGFAFLVEMPRQRECVAALLDRLAATAAR
jgi:hypothetical protein